MESHAYAALHRHIRAASAFLIGFAFPGADGHAQNWQAVREKVRDSIVHIESVRFKSDGTNRETFSATGFIVSCRGHVLTVAHAVPRPAESGFAEYRASRMSRNIPKTRVEVITRDDDLDLALLQFPGIQDWKPLDFVDRSANVPEDARLYTLGFPLNSDLSSAEGLLSSHFGVGGRWQTTLPINYGNSGGPVFDIAGRVVGIAVGGFDHAKQITYVTQADYMRSLRSLLPTSCTQREPEPVAAQASRQTTQTFQFSVTVDHQERKEVSDVHCLPEGFRVTDVTSSISSANGNGTRLISANPIPDRLNCIELKAFVQGNGVDRLGGIVVNHRGRGWLAGQLNVQGARN
jgi:Trypsin-like peptidase domain